MLRRVAVAAGVVAGLSVGWAVARVTDTKAVKRVVSQAQALLARNDAAVDRDEAVSGDEAAGGDAAAVAGFDEARGHRNEANRCDQAIAGDHEADRRDEGDGDSTASACCDEADRARAGAADFDETVGLGR